MPIKTAEQHIAAISKSERQRAAERREYKAAKAQLEFVEDLRDDVMSLVANSGLSFEAIEDRCGPCVRTLETWKRKEVRQPRLGTMRAVLRILGKDLGIVG